MVGLSVPFPLGFFIFTASGDTEALLPDSESIGMDYGVDENTIIGCIGFHIGEPQRVTDVPNIAETAAAERSSSHPDTGIISVDITIDFLINEKTQSNPKPLAKLLKWSVRAQTVRALYPRGRFCLRNDKLGGLPTILADNLSGIRFKNLAMDDQIEWSDHQTGTIFLEFVGDYSAWVVLLNAIINA